MDAFVDKICVAADGSLDISLKFKDEMKELEDICAVLRKEVA